MKSTVVFIYCGIKLTSLILENLKYLTPYSAYSEYAEVAMKPRMT